jgi:hypothetical protein
VVAAKERRLRLKDQRDRDSIPGMRLVTADEGRALFDRYAQQLLAISGSEFLRRWDAGAYRPIPDTPEGRKVRRLVMLMPFARRTNA